VIKLTVVKLVKELRILGENSAYNR